jgi:hypothetical protein
LTRQRSLKGRLIDELIHKMDRIPQSMDGNRHKIENRICIQWVNEYQDIGTVIESVELSDTDWMVTINYFRKYNITDYYG